MPMLTAPAATWLRPVPLLVGVCWTVALGLAASKRSLAAATSGSSAEEPFRVTVPLTGAALGVGVDEPDDVLPPHAVSRASAPRLSADSRERFKIRNPPNTPWARLASYMGSAAGCRRSGTPFARSLGRRRLTSRPGKVKCALTGSWGIAPVQRAWGGDREEDPGPPQGCCLRPDLA